jgi:membrane protein
VTSTVLLRVYDEHFSSYRRIYGPLKQAAVLLLWLYFTSAAILIGGEANSEIEKAAAEAGHADVRDLKSDGAAGPLRRPIQGEATWQGLDDAVLPAG